MKNDALLWSFVIIVIGIISLFFVITGQSVCLDASEWFIDKNNPLDPHDDHPFGFILGNC